jgi:hypothetical protein
MVTIDPAGTIWTFAKPEQDKENLHIQIILNYHTTLFFNYFNGFVTIFTNEIWP